MQFESLDGDLSAPVRGAVRVAAVVLLATFLAFGVSCTSSAEDDASGGDSQVPTPVEDAGGSASDDAAPSGVPGSARTGGSPEFAEQCGFAETYLMDVEELRALITEERYTIGSLERGVEGVPATVDEAYEVIDIRAMAAYARGFIPGSINIPGGGQFRVRIGEVDLAKRIVLVPDEKYRNVATVIGILLGEGVDGTDIFVLRGGIAAWADAGYTLNIVKKVGC